MEPLISLKNASVVYGNSESTVVKAVDNVSFDIYPEEYVIFFGPSGCGKSTLMYTIAGLERLTGGEIHVASKNLATLTEEEIIEFHRNTIGMVFQAYYLIPSLRILQNVVLPQIFLSATVADRENRGKELLERFGILPQANKYPTQLSGGQQQRVAIARALVNDPPILLADEPVGNLDSKSAEDVLRLLQELNKKDKKTIILVTHNPNHLKFAQRVLYMKDGKIIREVRNEEQETLEQKKRHEQEDTRERTINYGLRQFARVFPNADQETLKQKLLTSYLLDSIDVEAEQRLEKLVGDLMRGRIDRKRFIEVATGSLRTNGIGLYTSHAERLADKLLHATGLANFLVRNFKDFPRTYDEYQRILNQISEFIVRELELKLDGNERVLFDQAVKARLEGSITHDGFQDMLDRSVKDGGAGFNVRTAHNVARLMEILLIHFDEMEAERAATRPHLFGLRAGVRAEEEKEEGDAKNAAQKEVKANNNQKIQVPPEEKNINKLKITKHDHSTESFSEAVAHTVKTKEQPKPSQHISELKERQKTHAFTAEKQREKEKTVTISEKTEQSTFRPAPVRNAIAPALRQTPKNTEKPKRRSLLSRIFAPAPQPKMVQSTEKTPTKETQVMHSMRDDEKQFEKEATTPITKSNPVKTEPVTPASSENQTKESPQTKKTAHEIRRLLERGEIQSARSSSQGSRPSGIIFPQKIKK